MTCDRNTEYSRFAKTRGLSASRRRAGRPSLLTMSSPGVRLYKAKENETQLSGYKSAYVRIVHATQKRIVMVLVRLDYTEFSASVGIQYSQASLIRSSFIRIPRHPEEIRCLTPIYNTCHAYVSVCVFDYPVPSPNRIFSWKTDVCGYARSDCTAYR